MRRAKTTGVRPLPEPAPGSKKSQLPPRRDLFGVQVSVADYQEVARAVFAELDAGRYPRVSALPVHGLMLAVQRPSFRRIINAMDIVTPDGQPVRLALNLLHESGLADRVAGPKLTVEMCREAARRGAPVYLYGSHPHVVNAMAQNLCARFPGLVIAGIESPPFRPLTPAEDLALQQRVHDSGAKLFFVGLGLPTQERFIHQHRHSLRVAQFAVGAAFDFISGHKPWAPVSVQRAGLEWAFRLLKEPRRLWLRYLVFNSHFLLRLGLALAAKKFRG